jgi:hypothetical protein
MTMNTEAINPYTRPPTAAERMRLYRRRRRSGARSLRIQLELAAIGALVSKGYLEQGLRNDPSALQFAINSFIDEALHE